MKLKKKVNKKKKKAQKKGGQRHLTRVTLYLGRLVLHFFFCRQTHFWGIYKKGEKSCQKR